MSENLFSARHGRARGLDLDDFAQLVWDGIAALAQHGYFWESMVEHPDEIGEPVPPRLSSSDFLRRLKKSDVYPDLERLVSRKSRTGPPVSWAVYADVLWDSLEYLHAEAVSKPYREDRSTATTYSRIDGQQVFRGTLNPDLALFDPPMEMLDNGQIVEKAPDDLRPLLDDPVPEDVPSPLRDPLRDAIEQYRRRGASDHDKRSALKHLADVLEPLRDEIDEHILSADEKALFHLANKFWIRHNDREQQRNYDSAVWLDWIFYVYVATARALLAVIDRQQLSESVFGAPPDDNGGLPL